MDSYKWIPRNWFPKKECTMNEKRIAVSIQNLYFRFSKDTGFFGAIITLPIFKFILDYIFKKNINAKKDDNDQSPFKDIFTGISLDIYEGEIVGVLALNGSGKSTLLKIISGELNPYQGKIRIFGEDSLTDSMRRNILRIGPAADLFEGINSIQNVQVRALWYSLNPEDIKREFLDLAKKLMIPEVVLKLLPQQLSSGTKMKICIARDLAIINAMNRLHESRNHSPIFLIDEPSAYLDPIASKEFAEALMEVKKLIPLLSIIIATNNPQDLLICERLIVIHEKNILNKDDELEKIKKGIKEFQEQTLSTVIEVLSLDKTPKAGVIDTNDKSNGKFRISHINPIRFRTRKEIVNNYFMLFFFVFSLLIPNLIPLFVNGASFEKMIYVGLGVFFTLCFRGSYRILESEQSYFKNHVGMFFSGVPRWRHVMWHSMSGILNNTIYGFMTTVFLYLMYFGFSFQGPLQNLVLSTESLIQPLNILLISISGWFFIYGFGLICSPITKLMRENNSFFLLNILPFIAVISSGLYYPIENLPLLLRLIAELNPLTYIPISMSNANNQIHFDLIIPCFVKGIICFSFGYLVHSLGFKLIHLCNRIEFYSQK